MAVKFYYPERWRPLKNKTQKSSLLTEQKALHNHLIWGIHDVSIHPLL